MSRSGTRLETLARRCAAPALVLAGMACSRGGARHEVERSEAHAPGARAAASSGPMQPTSDAAPPTSDTDASMAVTPATCAARHTPSDDSTLTALESLGKALFEDASLSDPPGLACASCHSAATAYVGNHGSPVPAVARGSVAGALGTRNTPSILYAALIPVFSFTTGDGDSTGEEGGVTQYVGQGGLFWDGRADTLELQVPGPLLNPREMNNASVEAIVDKLRAGPRAADFHRLFGAAALDVTSRAMQHMESAIAAFERSRRFRRFSSKFDAYLCGEAHLSAKEMRGFELFKDPGKGNCTSCHAGFAGSNDPADWPFTDFGFEVLGVPRNPAIPANGDPTYFDLGLCKQPGLSNVAPADFGVEASCGAFRTPSLRNVARTAPYMHNGFFKTLRDVVLFYATRDTQPQLWYAKDAGGTVDQYDDLPPEYRGNVAGGVPFSRAPGVAQTLTDDEVDALVSFLETLSDT